MPSKRELIEPKGEKRFVRRDENGRFKESDDVGRSLVADRRQKATTTVKTGQGDRRRSRGPWSTRRPLLQPSSRERIVALG